MSDVNIKEILWLRGILNGVLAWLLALLVLMIPAIVVAVKMGFELGPQSEDSSEVSAKISEAISSMYKNNDWLAIAFISATTLFIFWRARAVVKKATGEYFVNSLLVAVFPVIISIASLFSMKFEFTAILEILVYSGAAYAAVYFRR